MTDRLEQDEIERRIADVRARLVHLTAEKKELERELRELLLSQERMIPASCPPRRVSDTFPPEKKIGIFRSLFRGRDDVFPRRFESRKTEVVIYDYADTKIPMTLRMFERRIAGDRSIGYRIADDREFVLFN
ncbi:MAG: hypothetical protein IJH79_06785 [Lentisphaeria bacterium]|nr:hypothetical protein [Lentisphaeria bacterium]